MGRRRWRSDPGGAVAQDILAGCRGVGQQGRGAVTWLLVALLELAFACHSGGTEFPTSHFTPLRTPESLDDAVLDGRASLGLSSVLLEAHCSPST